MISDREAQIRESLDELTSAEGEKELHTSSIHQTHQQPKAPSVASPIVQRELFINILPCSIKDEDIIQNGPILCLVYHANETNNFNCIIQTLKKSGKQERHKFFVKIHQDNTSCHINSHHQFIDEPTLEATIRLFLANNSQENYINVKAVQFDQQESQPTLNQPRQGLTRIEKVKLRINTAMEDANEQEKQWLKEIQVIENDGKIYLQFMEKKKLVRFQTQKNAVVAKILVPEIIEFVKDCVENDSNPNNNTIETTRRKRKRVSQRDVPPAVPPAPSQLQQI